MKKTIIIVGAGEGLGNHVAKKFGHNGFRVILMARSEKALKQYEEEFTAGGIEVYTYPADAAQPETLTSTFEKVKTRFGTPDILVYNVGITGQDEPGTINYQKLINHYQVDVAGAYHAVQQVVSDDFGQKNGVIILTGGGLALNPSPDYIPLSLDKAALRTLTFILNQQLKDRGIFVGTITVTGRVAPGTHFAPDLIAEKYWQMYTERKECEIVY